MMRFVWPVLFLGIAALFVWSLLSEPARNAPAVEASAQPRYTVRGAQWRRLDENGKPSFDASAEVIDYYDDHSARLQTIEVTALGGRGAPWRLSAPRGEAPYDFGRVKLTGGVEGEGRWPDGEPLRVETSELWLDSEKETIETEAAVRLKSRTREAEGRGLKVDGKTDKLWLKDDVDMRYAQ